MFLYFYIFIFVLGLIIGSFLNALIWRLYKGESVLKGRSRCPDCGHVLSVVDLIPVLSFVFQAGRCRYCRKPISWQYPLVELSTAVLFVLTSLNYLSPLITAVSPYHLIILFRDFFFLSILIITFVTDLRWGLIFDKVVVSGIIVALLSILFTIPYPLIPNTYLNLLIAGAIGAGVFGLQYLISKGRWIGSGDIYLGGLLGLIVGFPKILYVLFTAYVGGALIALLLIALGKKTFKDTIPLGVFLAGAGILFVLLS